ncbi:YigZ family protein [Poseidonibacter lekithochrous]|uniref:YigZ family protein n=1 Tax=Poseidonibacter lekithochrous TaxID=1904463 RepID=UPI000D3C7A23|nr:YigZ family protein [Poseidonibacter lekithochrous]
MKFIQEEYENTYEEKKSKFIAHLMPYENFHEVMIKLKEKHPKGRHFVYAYRYLNEFDQVVENSSDDGEPKGTSGKPSLAVLAGSGMINTGVIIVRYFGGIKLGTGGLVRAYGDSVNEVLTKATFFEYKKLMTKKLKCSYPDLSKLEYLLKQEDISIKDKEFSIDVILNIELTSNEWQLLLAKLPISISEEK